MPFLGGHHITAITWIDAQSILVRYTSTYTRHSYQLYAGRVKIGDAADPAARSIVGALSPSHYPQVITLLAVDGADVGVDHGAQLPPRPYNVAELLLDTSGLEADAAFVDLYAGSAPGGAIDTANRLKRLPFAGAAALTLRTPPLGPSGNWSLRAQATDSRPTGGNAGSALDTTLDILAHPPDVTPDASDNRFTLALTAGALTVSTTVPSNLAV